MKLYLIRHGQTVTNVQRVYTGQADVPLTPLGRQQAEAIRPILQDIPFDKVFTSDLSRAVDTQRLALPGIEGEPTPLLREYAVGSLEKVSFTQCDALLGKETGRTNDFSAFGGESTPMVCSRLKEFLTSLEQQPWENVAAFAHNGIMKCMLRLVLNTDFDGSVVPSNNCAVHVFAYEGGKWKLLAWNYMSKV